MKRDFQLLINTIKTNFLIKNQINKTNEELNCKELLLLPSTEY